jgi:hypothetical protein
MGRAEAPAAVAAAEKPASHVRGPEPRWVVPGRRRAFLSWTPVQRSGSTIASAGTSRMSPSLAGRALERRLPVEWTFA